MISKALLSDSSKNIFINEDIIPTLTSQLNEYIHKSSDEAVTKQKLYATRKSDLEKQKKYIVEAITKTGYSNIFDSNGTCRKAFDAYFVSI